MCKRLYVQVILLPSLGNGNCVAAHGVLPFVVVSANFRIKVSKKNERTADGKS